MTGLVTAVYDIGCALGAVAAFVWGENIGRKQSIIVANIIVIVGTAVQTASFDYWQMFASRIVAGVGVDFSIVVVPILQSETFPAHNRGALLVVQVVLTVGGSALASWLCFATRYASSSVQWRFPIASQIFLSGLTLIGTAFIPESPKWLAKHKREDESMVVISRLWNVPLDANEAEGQLSESLQDIADENVEEEPTGREVFRTVSRMRNLHRVVLGLGPFMMNQRSGINSVSALLQFWGLC